MDTSNLIVDENTTTFFNEGDVDTQNTPSTYQEAFFQLSAEAVASDSNNNPFDIVIIGSGIGGGVLAIDLLEKNKQLAANGSCFPGGPILSDPNRSTTVPDKSIRILVIEKGGLLFTTHSLNTPGPTTRGTYGQMNDLFYNKFKRQYDMDSVTAGIWKGGPVYSLGGRSPVWGLFCPRINDHTFESNFPKDVYEQVTDRYYSKAENMMHLAYPETLPPHQALIDKLNLKKHGSKLPTTQWKWGRVASEFRDPNNFDFAQGAFSTTDRLLEAAMDDEQGKGKFKILLNSHVDHLSPAPSPSSSTAVEHVVVKDGETSHEIKCNNVVLCAGSVESPAILLRSTGMATLTAAYGSNFVERFGHVTDHYIFYVGVPFFYRNVEDKARLGGMKLMTDITFTQALDGTALDGTAALANISLDASSFLPRRNVPDSNLPQFIIAYILPSALASTNTITLNACGEPKIKVGYANNSQLVEKKRVLVHFAVDVMNKVAGVLDIQFAKKDGNGYTPYPTITEAVLSAMYPNGDGLGELGPGGVAHELGSIPMPTPDRSGPNKPDVLGIVDKDLKMNCGWSNVYVCDLSVFPHSPAANPTLTLGALALRLSDTLSSRITSRFQGYHDCQPIIVFNLTSTDVWVTMTLSRKNGLQEGGKNPVKITKGKSYTWKREQRETIYIRDPSNPTSENFDVQVVYPGINATIIHLPPPPPSSTERCRL